MIPVPHTGDYPAYFTTYIAYLNGADPLATLRQYALGEYIGSLPPEKLEYRYAEGKWTPKDILLHLADSERIFQYRILRFARDSRRTFAARWDDRHSICQPPGPI